jgi:hypothetical protein
MVTLSGKRRLFDFGRVNGADQAILVLSSCGPAIGLWFRILLWLRSFGRQGLRAVLYSAVPLDRAKTMFDGGLKQNFRLETAGKTCGAHVPDVCLFAYVIVPRAHESGDDWPVTLRANEGGEMQIVGRGFIGRYQAAVPGHRRHRSGVNNWNISHHRNLRHQTLFQAYELF